MSQDEEYLIQWIYNTLFATVEDDLVVAPDPEI